VIRGSQHLQKLAVVDVSKESAINVSSRGIVHLSAVICCIDESYWSVE
jgi:hypothetical protein